MSANHAKEYDRAVQIIKAAKNAGADCIKVQTYTPDTLTLDSNKDHFLIKKGTWSGERLYELYQKACMPWEWQGRLQAEANRIGLDFLSTVYDRSSVDFLESLGVNCYKIASFELVDIPLLRYVASKQKPILLSTGMANLGEIERAVNAIREQGNEHLCLLKCTSDYPADLGAMNLRTIPNMAETFGVPVGFSDHSLGSLAAVVAVSQGARVIEKHFTISRAQKSPDSTFSMEPEEFKAMVADIRAAEKALGKVTYEQTESEIANKRFRKSIIVTKDIKMGEAFTGANVGVLRPSDGLEPRYYDEIIQKKARRDITRGTPLQWDLIE